MSSESSEMPTIPFGPHRISRLIVGGNQQGGASHNVPDMGMHMIEYFTPERTTTFIKECLAEGINTWQGNYGPNTVEVVRKLREEGKEINTLPLSAPELPGLSEKQLRHVSHPALKHMNGQFDGMLEELKPTGVILWGSLTDVLFKEGKMEEARDFLKQVRQTGVQVGVATHMPEVIEYIDEKDWDVDFYLAAVYQFEKCREEVLKIVPEEPLDVDRWGGMQLILPSERPKMCDAIRKTPKTCIAFKLLAAGRAAITPGDVKDAFEYVLGHIKPTDAVCVGMYPRFRPQMIKNNADLVREFG
jgi:pentatricopeptide repeat protein